MTFYATRRWLPPICLVALIAAVWALPYRPDCDSLAWGDDPAIARIDSQCILLSHYANSLHIVETTIENAEFGLLIDEHASNDYQRRWNDRLSFYGPETLALAGAIRDSALYQGAGCRRTCSLPGRGRGPPRPGPALVGEFPRRRSVGEVGAESGPYRIHKTGARDKVP